MPKAQHVKDRGWDTPWIAINCPACRREHYIDERWTFNGNFDAPTFTPSLLCTYGKGDQPPEICHSFITDGKIQFCGDCTHDKANQTLDLLDY